MDVLNALDQIVIYKMPDTVGVCVVKAVSRAVALDRPSLMNTLVSVKNPHIRSGKEDASPP